MKGYPLIIIFLCFLFWGCSQKYEVQLHRPLAVGDQQHWAINGVINRMTANLTFGFINHKTSEEFHYQFEGVVTIKAIDEKGQPQHLDCLVSVFTKSDGASGLKTDILPKESMISCAYDDGNILFKVDGEAATEELVAHLRRLFQLPPPNLTMDAIWGVSKRKKVGDEWSANLELLVKQFQLFGIKVNPELITNSMSLKSAETVDGIPILEFEWHLNIPDAKNSELDEKGFSIEAKYEETGTLRLAENPNVRGEKETSDSLLESKIGTSVPYQKTLLRIKSHYEKRVSQVSDSQNLLQ